MSKDRAMNDKANKIMNELIKLIEVVANGKRKVFDCGGVLLYRGEIHMLKKVGDAPGIYISEMARHFNVTRAVVSKTVIKLEREGLVRKEADPVDKKLACLYLTQKGRKACAIHNALHRASDSDIFEFLDALKSEEMDVIEAFMKEANKMVQHHF
ncbi:DNA-binding transcriptional regulator, MarR family [Desulfotomaculum arcticum]|uniref:DNA-binding transcriptional regulator, MarR family n=1 Tax=Desulfotruncus arcticus DSM 17038 TaxID=1121424 RepID=A0A1I2P9L6_9FIRM|nr:MarR family transcriptional regulator [Desulfotruncus arcticus]SFG10647.1 DNA-binding transcriptional regulator, MarR family [Desulfotomaculum arcticum] [Desulfotruncus arcticus DSM 17038]